MGSNSTFPLRLDATNQPNWSLAFCSAWQTIDVTSSGKPALNSSYLWAFFSVHLNGHESSRAFIARRTIIALPKEEKDAIFPSIFLFRFSAFQVTDTGATDLEVPFDDVRWYTKKEKKNL